MHYNHPTAQPKLKPKTTCDALNSHSDRQTDRQAPSICCLVSCPPFFVGDSPNHSLDARSQFWPVPSPLSPTSLRASSCIYPWPCLPHIHLCSRRTLPAPLAASTQRLPVFPTALPRPTMQACEAIRYYMSWRDVLWLLRHAAFCCDQCACCDSQGKGISVVICPKHRMRQMRCQSSLVNACQLAHPDKHPPAGNTHLLSLVFHTKFTPTNAWDPHTHSCPYTRTIVLFRVVATVHVFSTAFVRAMTTKNANSFLANQLSSS